MVRDRFLRAENMNYFFIADIENLLLKSNGVRERRPNFAIFVVWDALIVGGWVLVIYGRKYYLRPAET